MVQGLCTQTVLVEGEPPCLARALQASYCLTHSLVGLLYRQLLSIRQRVFLCKWCDASVDNLTHSCNCQTHVLASAAAGACLQSGWSRQDHSLATVSDNRWVFQA